MMADAKIRAVLDRYDRMITALIVGEHKHPANARLEHLHSMIPKMRAMLDQCDDIMDNSLTPVEDAIPVREKLMCWLGFMQGAFWTLDLYTIDEMRAHNMPDNETFHAEGR